MGKGEVGMKVEVINTCKETKKYIERVKKGECPNICWEEEVVSVYWERLCCYAPFDLSERKPKAITDILALEKQCELLEKLDVNRLICEFERVTSILPNYDDDTITVAIFLGDNNNISLNEKQNGVVGTSLFGNMFIQVNPLIQGYEHWIKYVFAHEYHHTVWGNYWFMLHSGELENKFINSLIIDGEADSFAMELYPALKPQWLFGMSEEEVSFIWDNKYKTIVESTEVDYVSYMFGNEELEIPWCAGYAVGYMLVQKYLSIAKKSVIDILELKPEFLLEQLISR